jgi:hypothetical protein
LRGERDKCGRDGGRGFDLVEFNHGRIWFRGNGQLLSHGDAIGAARTPGDISVGNDLFACLEGMFFPGPENVPTLTIREVDQGRLLKLTYAGALKVESCVVFRNRWIAQNGIAQFCSIAHSSGHDGVVVRGPAHFPGYNRTADGSGQNS